MRAFVMGLVVGVGLIVLWAMHRWGSAPTVSSEPQWTLTRTPSSGSSVWWQEYNEPLFWTKVH